MVMVLNDQVGEGDEFLLYAFPNDKQEKKFTTPLLRLRGVLSSIRGTTEKLIGQEFRVSSLSGDRSDGRLQVKVASAQLAGSLVFALIAPEMTQNFVLCSMLSSLLGALEMVYGPLTGDPSLFLNLIGYEEPSAYDPDRVNVPRAAKMALDPFFKLYFPSFLSGPPSRSSTRLLEALPQCLPCHAPPLQLQSLFDLELMSLNDKTNEASTGKRTRMRSVRGGSAGSTIKELLHFQQHHPDGEKGSGDVLMVSESALWYRGRLASKRMSSTRTAEISRFCRLHRLLFRKSGSALHVSTHWVHVLQKDECTPAGRGVGSGGERFFSSPNEHLKEKLNPLLRPIAVKRVGCEGGREVTISVSPRTVGRIRVRLLLVGVGSFLCACLIDGDYDEDTPGNDTPAADYKSPRAKFLSGANGNVSSKPPKVPVVLVSRIKAMIARMQRNNMAGQLDALAKMELDLISKDAQPEPTNGSSRWTTHSMTKKLFKSSAMSEPSILEGPYNTLAYYLNVFHLQGLIVSCHPHDFSHGPESIADRFIETLLKIHHIFARRNSKRQVEGSKMRGRSQIAEIGQRIQIRGGTTNQKTYWIIGRRDFSGEREAYVCFRDSIPQDMINVLFKTTFAM